MYVFTQFLLSRKDVTQDQIKKAEKRWFESRVFLLQTKAKESSLPNYLPIVRAKNRWIHTSPKSISIKSKANNLMFRLPILFPMTITITSVCVTPFYRTRIIYNKVVNEKFVVMVTWNA